MDHGLVKRLRSEVGDRLAAQRRLDATSGAPAMSAEDERQFARALIAQALEGHARAEITAGRAPLTAQEEEELATGDPRRAVRRRAAAAAAGGRADREHRHQRLRPGIPRLRRRPGGHGRAGGRQRRGTGRADPGARRLLGAVQPPVRHRPPAAGPAAARRLPAVRGDGRDAAARDLHQAGPAWQGVPRRPGWQRDPAARARGLPDGRHGRQEEHHDRRGDQRGEDHLAAGDRGQPDPGGRAPRHRGARARTRHRPFPRAAPQRGRPGGTAAQLRGGGRHLHGRAWSAARCG